MVAKLGYWWDLLLWLVFVILVASGILVWAAWDAYRRLRAGDPGFLWSLVGVGAGAVLLQRGWRVRPEWDCDCPQCCPQCKQAR